MKRPSPLDAPRDFRINEMFFSTTDSAGRILSGNDVFVRVSGYARERMVGQPHSLIRHPDMPRTVFRLVWDHLKRDRAVAGLIKNLACDGRYYWVIAYLVPIEGGFLSIRFKPSGELQPVVEALYRRMVECEQAQERQGADHKAAMAASEKLLNDALRKRGFDDYDAFMRTLLHEELKSRDAVLAGQRLALFPPELTAATTADALNAGLGAVHGHGRKVYEQINTLYAQLDEFALLNEKIAAKSSLVLKQTADFRFIAFNAALRSARLGEEARGLGVISEYLSGGAEATARIVRGLGERISAISDKLSAVIFNLAAARLQIEMVLSFCAELAAGGDAGSDARVQCTMIGDLQRAFGRTAQRAVATLSELDEELGGLDARSEDLRKMVLSLQVAQVTGMVEASRLIGDDSFEVMFSDLRGRVEATKQELSELNDIGSRLAKLAEKTPAIAAIISTAVSQMEAEVRTLSTLPVPQEPAVRVPGLREVPPSQARDGRMQLTAA
jgi:aerotaxis receptor